ncbi:unnamed protein product [Prorocentrum cordatum]|uniref:Uncharacterized protein n=1 Tax=Prorocentrum cordatum TaxID=2364126 RepID=A0ABN9XY75_9DINO|nr:unnamed protein product [Polarella glacialis]
MSISDEVPASSETDKSSGAGALRTEASTWAPSVVDTEKVEPMAASNSDGVLVGAETFKSETACVPSTAASVWPPSAVGTVPKAPPTRNGTPVAAEPARSEAAGAPPAEARMRTPSAVDTEQAMPTATSTSDGAPAAAEAAGSKAAGTPPAEAGRRAQSAAGTEELALTSLRRRELRALLKRTWQKASAMAEAGENQSGCHGSCGAAKCGDGSAAEEGLAKTTEEGDLAAKRRRLDAREEGQARDVKAVARAAWEASAWEEKGDVPLDERGNSYPCWLWGDRGGRAAAAQSQAYPPDGAGYDYADWASEGWATKDGGGAGGGGGGGGHFAPHADASPPAHPLFAAGHAHPSFCASGAPKGWPAEVAGAGGLFALQAAAAGATQAHSGSAAVAEVPRDAPGVAPARRAPCVPPKGWVDAGWIDDCAASYDAPPPYEYDL